MTDSSPEVRIGKAWPAAAVIISAIGGVSVVVFTVWWWIRVSGNCGVVRFYEQAFAVILAGCWFIGTAVGIGLTVHGYIKRSRTMVPGAVIAILVNLGSVLVCAKVVHTVREADFSLKSTGQLMEFLNGENIDNRQYAAVELGERRAVEAVSALCAILDDTREYINLRLNASTALGRICAPPPPSKEAVDQAVASLIKALKDKDKFIPEDAAGALERIGTPEALEALERFRNPSIDASAGFLGEWELRDGKNKLTVTFNPDGEAVLDKWDAAAVRNHHLDSFWEEHQGKITVDDLKGRQWLFHFRQGRLFFTENGVEKEMLRVGRKTNKEE